MTMSTVPKPSGETTKSGAVSPDIDAMLMRRHLNVGWWCLLVFLTMGLVLEGFHGFKVTAYLGVSNETRRLMWTLSHAHGTLLGLVNLSFAFTLRLLPEWKMRPRQVASLCLRGATLLMPSGFFLGGLFAYSGDPGLGILLLPVGALMLLICVFLIAVALKHLQFESRMAAAKRK